MICTSNNCSNIFEEFAGSSEFTIFTRFIKQAGLVDYLKNTENLIVFVPNNAAFNKLDKAIINALKNPENYQILSNILKFHITFGKILKKDITTTHQYVTVEGNSVVIYKFDGKYFVNKIKINRKITKKNGIIFVIDEVMIPN